MNNPILSKDEQQTRAERLDKIIKNNTPAYPSVSLNNPEIKKVVDEFDQYLNNQNKLGVAGRLRSIRLHGGSCFADLTDQSGKIQIYFKKDEVGENAYQFFNDCIDIGDFLEINGLPFITKKGEKTVIVKSFSLLAKALLPLPEKWHGLNDVEIRYRQRYLDLLANPEVKEIFLKRSQIVQTIRNFLIFEGFLEVDTPILQPIASGAIARPFKTHHHALKTDLYLRIAPELYLKELVIGGLEKVFEFARCFRNEGIDYSHNPEFTQVELYWAYKNYEDLMLLVENLFAKLLTEVFGSLEKTYNGQLLNFKPPFNRLDFNQALIDYAQINLDEHDVKSLSSAAKKAGLKTEKSWGKGKIADELFKKFVRPNLIQPTFIINHPLELSPLAKTMVGRPNYVERFQLIVAGRYELVNGFTELNDPLEQEERFKFQKELAKKGDDEAMTKDEDFVEALKYGLPPTAGLGMGIDRLVNLLTDTQNIREVILFPTLKNKNG